MAAAGDWQRVLRGVALVLQELARQQTPVAAQRLGHARKHASEVVTAAGRLPHILAAAHSQQLRHSARVERDIEEAFAAAAAANQSNPDDAEPFAASAESPLSTSDRNGVTSEWPAPAPELSQLSGAPSHLTAMRVDGGDGGSTSNFGTTAAGVPLGVSSPEVAANRNHGVSLPSTTRMEVPHGDEAAAVLSIPAPAAPVPSPSITVPLSPTAADPAPAAASPPPPPRKREFRERAVPASPLARAWGFGTLGASLAFSALTDALRVAAVGPGGGAAAAAPGGGALRISEVQAERLAEGLCRMRGAALKLGQMLSLADESILPPAIAAALERVRTQADVMPRRQLDKVMAAELGPDWRARLGGPDGFVDAPVAAASIGQVHRATLPDGRVVAVKVQYPGVGDSINSDLDNLQRLLMFSDVLPKGLYLDAMIAVAREELTAECDYVREADAQERFRGLVGGDPDFAVPSVVRELSTKRVLVTTWLDGVAIDQVTSQHLPVSQEARNRIAQKLLKLTLKELFEWRFMQTDPNWGNFFFDPATDRIGLLDFGAAREFPKSFVDSYLRLVWAAANDDGATIRSVSQELGFLTGLESEAMLKAHVASGMIVGEPFRRGGAFDFRAAGITARISQYGAVFAAERLTPPPPEVYSLHRKLAGAFLICIRMGAQMECRAMLEEVWENYKFGPLEGEGGPGKGVGVNRPQA